MDLHRELVDRANANLAEMSVEANPSKRAWLGGGAQALLSVANYLEDGSPSAQELAAEVETRLSKVAEAVGRLGHRAEAQYEVGKVAGLNLVRRLMRDNAIG